jgi:hypothetical protein
MQQFFKLLHKCVLEEARSKPKCNIFKGECCMGKCHGQLSIEERTMIQTQLAMGMTAAAIAQGFGRVSLNAVA